MTGQSDIRERLDRLESLVEQQQETIRAQRERIARLDSEEDTQNEDGESVAVSRRGALKAGGVLAALGLGVGTASADAQGQVGTSSDPLNTLYTEELYGNSGTVTVQDDLDLNGNPLISTSVGTDFLTDVDSTVSGEEDFAVEINDISGDKPTVRWRRESDTDNALVVETDDGVTSRNRLQLDDDGNLAIGGNLTNSSALTVETTATGDLTLDAAGTVTLGSTLDLDGNDLEDDGATIWDTENSYVPRDRVQTPENVVVVAKSGGDYMSVNTALSNVTEPAIVWVAPGEYDITADPAPDIPAGVTLVGASREATTLYVDGGYYGLEPSNGGASIRSLSLEWRSGSGGFAMIQSFAPDLVVRDVNITDTGGEVDYGLEAESGSSTIVDSKIDLTNTSDAHALFASGGDVTARNCFLKGADSAGHVNDPQTLSLANNEVINGTTGTGTVNKVGNFDGGYNAV
ncbi:MAG: hypothetical protein ACI8TL_001499 [Natronomonas sp.]|jgi:hypothetical protein